MTSDFAFYELRSPRELTTLPPVMEGNWYAGRDAAGAFATFAQSGARWSPIDAHTHATEAVRALSHWLTSPARWWAGRQARRARVHVQNVNRALVTGHPGAGTSGLPVADE